MKNILIIISLVLSNVLFAQEMYVSNDTVYLNSLSIGILKHDKEVFVSIGDENSIEKYTTLYTFTYQEPEVVKVIKNEIGINYDNFEVKQRSYINDKTNPVVGMNKDLYRAGQALKRSGNYQIIGLIGIPLAFINPIIGGTVALVGAIGSIYENNRAGRILSGEL